MKKLVLSVLTVGAMATGGIAQAQDVLGSVLPQILGNVLGNSGVLGQGSYPAGSVYIDQHGRQIQVDQYGRHLVIGQGNIYGGVVQQGAPEGQLVLNADGTYSRVITNSPVYVDPRSGLYAGRITSRDRDGDGVRNSRDRYPDDPRYR